MNELGQGLRDLGRGLDFLKQHPSLWKWLVAPALVTLLVLVAIVLGVWYAIDPFVVWVASHVPAWLETIVSWILRIVIVAGVGVIAAIIFVAVAGMVAGPFNEMLSEAVEEKLTGTPGPPFRFGAFVTSAIVGILHAVRRLLGSLVAMIALFILGFIPVVGTIGALAIGAYIAGRAAAYDSYDAVMSRRGLAYRDKIAYLDRMKSRSLGLGLGVTGMMLVPGLNLVALGIGAVAATLVDHDPGSAGTRDHELRTETDPRPR